MDWKQKLLALAIAIIFVSFVAVGIDTFYKAQKTLVIRFTKQGQKYLFQIVSYCKSQIKLLALRNSKIIMKIKALNHKNVMMNFSLGKICTKEMFSLF